MRAINTPQIYVAHEPIDLRKSIDGLSLMVSQVFQHDPFQGQLFVFTNRRRDKIKLLHWDTNGFWLSWSGGSLPGLNWPEGRRCLRSSHASCNGCWKGWHWNSGGRPAVLGDVQVCLRACPASGSFMIWPTPTSPVPVAGSHVRSSAKSTASNWISSHRGLRSSNRCG